MSDRHAVAVKVAGPWACFTRPEMKVERVSYPVMTPSAARGVLEAILWKPEFRWVVRRILVLAPVRFQAVRRNEIQDKIPVVTVKKWMKDPAAFKPYYADLAGRADGGHRTQRNTVALRDVAYVIEASVHLPRPSETDPPVKFREMFDRRVEKGQCYHRPYLGCREFTADFEPAPADAKPINETFSIGRMLYDIVYSPSGNRPVFFEARLDRGVLDCDPDRVLPDAAERKEVIECSFRP